MLINSDSITIKLSNSQYISSYLIHGLIHSAITTNSMNLEIDELTVSSGTFFLCKEDHSPTLFNLGTKNNSINIANLAITNL